MCFLCYLLVHCTNKQVQKQEANMAKSLTKPVFWVPSTEVLERIHTSDKASALQASSYRFSARMRELETQFETKAAELRAEYLAEAEVIHQGEAA